MSDLYSLLGVSLQADNLEIKSAYRALAKRTHPDLNFGDAAAEQRTKEINRAYEILSDPLMRAAYDLELSQFARARRRSLSTTAAIVIAVITFMLGAATVSMTTTWRHETEILLQKDASGNIGLIGGDNAAEQQAESPLSATPKEVSYRANTASESLKIQTLRVTGEPPAGENEAVADAAPPTPTSEPRQLELPVAPAAAPETRPRIEIASAASLEATSKPRPPVAMVVRQSNRASRDSRRNQPLWNSAPPKAAEPNRETRLVATSTTALRWPSADEPFVNVGAGSR